MFYRWSWEVEDTFTKGKNKNFCFIFVLFWKYLVAKGQKMAMKNYAKQLITQIEEVVAEVRFKSFTFDSYQSFVFRFEIH